MKSVRSLQARWKWHSSEECGGHAAEEGVWGQPLIERVRVIGDRRESDRRANSVKGAHEIRPAKTPLSEAEFGCCLGGESGIAEGWGQWRSCGHAEKHCLSRFAVAHLDSDL